MTHRRFVISDTHFGHKNVLKFEPIRNFANVEEMDEELVKRWNEVVRPVDTVYHLGDVVMARRHLTTVERLNGRKILIRGNHDLFTTKDFLKHFKEIRGCSVYRNCIMTHIPIHPVSVDRWDLNIHGHLHSNSIDDPRYVCVSVEHTDFYPIDLDELIDKMVARITVI